MPPPTSSPATLPAAVPAPGRSSRWDRIRWTIMTLIFLGTFINYIDRQTLSVLAPALQKDLGLTNFQYAKIGTVFLLTYSLSMSAWGWIFDRLGNRIAYALAIAWWSLAEMAHGGARGLMSFAALRGALGLGESGAWPGAARTVTAWFEPGDRALGIGISNAGTAIGSAVAAPVIVLLYSLWGWRVTFVATGALGFIWLAAWLLLYPRQEPPQTPPASPISSDGLRSGSLPGFRSPSANDPRNAQSIPPLSRTDPRDDKAAGRRFYAHIFLSRPILGLIAARFLCDPVWWLYVNWLPLYLHNARGFTLREIGASAWFPFLCAGLGSLAGGLFSRGVILRTGSVNLGRKWAVAVGGLLMPVGAGAIWVASPYAALGCIGVALFAFQFWIGNVQALPTDLVGMRALGSVSGAAGTAAGLGAMIFTLSTGWVVDHFSYTPILVVAGCLAPVASLILLLTLGSIQRID